MKRTVGSLSLVALSVGALAQANFTIVRPVDGARVREKVKILFPKGSVPAGAYVGIFLNGQLIDSMMPPINGKYQEYVLDTKGRALPDTPAGKPDRLEAKLYVNYNDQPRIVRTSSVDLNIANTASIRVPNSGFKLRYRFQPGTEMTYRVTQRTSTDTISEEQNNKGGIAAQLPVDSETFRMTYAIDNAYPDGSGLMRMQAAPIKGKDYAILTVHAQTGPEKFRDTDMAAIYMRLTPTGKEIFGSIPLYYGLDATSAAGSKLNLFAAFPLPSLPEKAVRPGDSWQTRFQDGRINLDKLYSQTSVIASRGPARGEFVGVEWEMGHPCAKIKNAIAIAELSDEDKKLQKQGAAFAGSKIKEEELIWFAMDTRQVIKVQRDSTIETKVENAGGGGSPYGGGAPMGGGSYPGAGGRPGMMGPGGGGSGGRADETSPPVPNELRQGFPGRGGRGGRGGAGAPPGMGGYPGMGGRPGMGGPGGQGSSSGGRNGAGSSANSATYIRVHQQMIFVLEG